MKQFSHDNPQIQTASINGAACVWQLQTAGASLGASLKLDEWNGRTILPLQRFLTLALRPPNGPKKIWNEPAGFYVKSIFYSTWNWVFICSDASLRFIIIIIILTYKTGLKGKRVENYCTLGNAISSSDVHRMRAGSGERLSMYSYIENGHQINQPQCVITCVWLT